MRPTTTLSHAASKVLGRGLIFAALAIVAGCVMTAREMVGAGAVEPAEFEQVLPFLQIRDTVIVEAQTQTQTQTHTHTHAHTHAGTGAQRGRFLLDTGANISVLDRADLSGETLTVSGAGTEEAAMTTTRLESLYLGGVRFTDTYVASGDLSGLALVIPGFKGLLGQPVIAKADWAIDYRRGELRLGSGLQPDPSMYEIPVHYRLGLPHVVLMIDGVSVEALLDSGASTFLALPETLSLAKTLESRYPAQISRREIFAVGGTREVTQKTLVLPAMRIGDLTLNDVPIELRDTSRVRLGARFLADRGRVLIRGGGNLWVEP